MALINYKSLADKKKRSIFSGYGNFFKQFFEWPTNKETLKEYEAEIQEIDKDEDHDWWSKYYASIEVCHK